jgi:hypothetical protein
MSPAISSLSRLGAVGLLALSAVKAVQSAVQNAANNSKGPIGTGMQAAAGGTTPQFMSAFGNLMAERSGNNDLRTAAPEWLAKVQQLILKHQKEGTGEIVEMFKFLPNVDWPNATPEELIKQTAEHAAKLSPM